jgi:hypothetical protein
MRPIDFLYSPVIPRRDGVGVVLHIMPFGLVLNIGDISE